MADKNVFTQELSKVFTILQEVRLVKKYIKELIDSNNLTEDKVVEIEEKLNQYKRDLDYIDENTEQLQESLNQININLGDAIEYIDSIKDFIDQNENIIEIGGDLEVGGALRVSSNISAENMNIRGELSLPSANNLILGDGSINVQDLIEYVDSIKDFIDQNENTIEIGGNLEVGGALRVSSNISAENMNIRGELSLPSTSNLIFEDGSTIGGGGSGKYLHNVVIQSENSTSVDYYLYLSFTYISDNNSTFGQYFDDFLEELYRLGYKDNKYLAASGCYIKKDKSNFVIISGVNSSNSLGSSISYKGCSFNLSPITYEENTLYCIASTFYVSRSIPKANLDIISHDVIEL